MCVEKHILPGPAPITNSAGHLPKFIETSETYQTGYQAAYLLILPA